VESGTFLRALRSNQSARTTSPSLKTLPLRLGRGGRELECRIARDEAGGLQRLLGGEELVAVDESIEGGERVLDVPGRGRGGHPPMSVRGAGNTFPRRGGPIGTLKANEERKKVGTMGPIRAFRDNYVALYGGVSYDLAPGAVGIDPTFLQDAPDLAGRRVLVSRGSGALLSLSRRPTFQVVSLTHLMRHALDASGEGAVVFSTFDLDDPKRARLLEVLELGDSVFLNAAIERLPDVAVRHPFSDSAS